MFKKKVFKTTDPSKCKRRQSDDKRENYVYFLPFIFDAEKEIDKEILNVIESTPFNKIQIPLQCNRGITEDGDSNRYVTVGNIISYNKYKMTFKVVLNKHFKDVIENKLAECEDGELVAVTQYSEVNGKLSTITKICIDVVDYGTSEEESSESLEEIDADEYDEDGCDDGSPIE